MTNIAARAPVEGLPARDQASVTQRSSDMFAVLGECVSLLARAPHFRNMSLADLEWAVLPALVNRQYLTMRGTLRRPEDGGPPVPNNTAIPLGMVLWARTSPQVSDKLATQQRNGTPFHLEPAEWRDGEDIWVLALVGPPQALPALRRQLELQFAGQTVQYFTVATRGDGEPGSSA